uniref:Uncharacterized protein n=1 Tax=Cacopsylla melanoneura TaxID=428564 RepID=A0A8D8XZI7_9HEMI
MMAAEECKRNFNRSRNEITELEDLITRLRNEKITEENYENLLIQWTTFRNKLKMYETWRDKLEEIIADEEELNVLIPEETENLCWEEYLCLVEIEAKLVQFQANRRRRKEKEDIEVRNQRENWEGKERWEKEDREYRRKLEEREHRREFEKLEREREEQEYRRDKKEREDIREREDMASRKRLEELDVRRFEIQSTLDAINPKNVHLDLPKIDFLRLSEEILDEYHEFKYDFSCLVDSKEDIDDQEEIDLSVDVGSVKYIDDKENIELSIGVGDSVMFMNRKTTILIEDELLQWETRLVLRDTIKKSVKMKKCNETLLCTNNDYFQPTSPGELSAVRDLKASRVKFGRESLRKKFVKMKSALWRNTVIGSKQTCVTHVVTSMLFDVYLPP